jgi:hypothetical protein
MGKRDEQRKLLLCIKKKMHQFSGQFPNHPIWKTFFIFRNKTILCINKIISTTPHSKEN